MSSKIEKDDPTAEARKQDHIELAFASRIPVDQIDSRFYYEPILAGHPTNEMSIEASFDGQPVRTPMWVSSMTGGTAKARHINHNLARACGEYGIGMGLGSCRSLLWDDEHISDFDVRHLVGDNPLYANLGIAQIQQLIAEDKLSLIEQLVERLQADGLIIHINPLQEWLQPEGDRYYDPPIISISQVLEALDIGIIVKEVGQGMGYESLKALLSLPLDAVDFAANGGTNFSKIELARVPESQRESLMALCNVGHSAEEMVRMTNDIVGKHSIACEQLIISGGITSFLDGYYLTEKSILPAVYGQASGFLKHSLGTYEELQAYVEGQINGLRLAHQVLRIK